MLGHDFTVASTELQRQLRLAARELQERAEGDGEVIISGGRGRGSQNIDHR